MLSWFSNTPPTNRAAAIIDVGSGSVGCAIVTVDILTKETSIVWTHREHTLLRTSQTKSDVRRGIKTALMNTFLELGNAGTRALNSFDPEVPLTDIQVTVSAPWQFTVPRTVQLDDTEPFVVDKKLIRDLNNLAEEEARKKVHDTNLEEQLGMQVIAHKYSGIRLDGYLVPELYDAKVREVSFTHVISLATEDIVNAINDGKEKVAPRTNISILPFVNVFYEVMTNLYPHTLESCLIDITFEATEISIVRDGAITHVAHIPVGVGSLAREISDALGLPAGEALTLLKSTDELQKLNISEKNLVTLQKLRNQYQLQIVDLFKNTGDNLSIPPTLFLHTSVQFEQYYKELLSEAAKAVSQSNHTVHLITSKLISESHQGDTAILLGAQHYFQSVLDTQIQ